ncbi:unnamed protein product [Rhizoctonia solani]|uniref:Protein kinase domain-containing protein n=1 Tax=Rhizoctonia solani TaxID=456999 RepID=A0A8H3HLF7_9AGAM|nr:unnamed protein product [Rhizoctonia solani]
MIVHEGHAYAVESVAFSPDGKSVVSGSKDYTARMWDAHNSSPIGEPLEGHSSYVHSVSYSPLGNLIASGSQDATIRLWDPITGQQSGNGLECFHALFSVAFAPDAKLIASGGGYFSSSTHHAVQLWDVQARKATSTLQGHTSEVTSVSFSPDSSRLVSGSRDKTIRVWDVDRETAILGPLGGHTDWARSTAFSPDGAQIVSCSNDHTIRLWDPRTGEMIGKPYTDHNGPVRSVSFSPWGTYIASGGDRTVRLWDIRMGRQVDQPFKEHTGPVMTVAFSPDGQYIASGSGDCKVVIRKVLDDQYPAADDDAEPRTINTDMEASKRDGPGVDLQPRMIISQASTQQIFDCLCHAGCIDLSSKMDTRQETAMIVSGGGFGDIWKGEMHTGVKVAIKAWRTYTLGPCEYKTLKRAARELHLWSRMDHPNIHRLQGVILFRDQYLGMVSEWMDNGNLHEYLLKHPEADRYQLCVHVTSGLEYMHSRGTVHGDLKALNVLVSSDGVARLSDFDFSIMSAASSLVFTATSNTRTGSIRWVPPEMLSGETPQRTKQSDVYALGMTMLEIYTREVPYSDRQHDGAVVLAVMIGTLPTRPMQHIKDDERGNLVWKIMLDCWSRTPNDRPSAGQVLQVCYSDSLWKLESDGGRT